MDSSTPLAQATAQDLQLELLRRTSFNALDGGEVAASLLRHRDLWLAAILDKPGVRDGSGLGRLPILGLIKLRDLPHDIWNADQLFVLTRTADQARELARIAEAEDWGGEVCVYDDPQEIGRALGGLGEDFGLMSVWRD